MIHTINLDQLLEIQEDIDFGLVIFLLNDELPDIGNENGWMANSQCDFYIVRMDIDSFKQMDFNTHPKTLIIKNGKDIKNLNGLLNEEAFGEIYELIKP